MNQKEKTLEQIIKDEKKLAFAKHIVGTGKLRCGYNPCDLKENYNICKDCFYIGFTNILENNVERKNMRNNEYLNEYLKDEIPEDLLNRIDNVVKEIINKSIIINEFEGGNEYEILY